MIIPVNSNASRSPQELLNRFDSEEGMLSILKLHIKHGDREYYPFSLPEMVAMWNYDKEALRMKYPSIADYIESKIKNYEILLLTQANAERFQTLMKRFKSEKHMEKVISEQEKAGEVYEPFSYDEIMFMGKYNLARLSGKYPSIADLYMSL